MANFDDVAKLRDALGTVGATESQGTADYQIVASMGAAFLARSRAGTPALLIPLEIAPKTVGRRGGGFSLAAADRVVFNYAERQWEQPAAALECTEPNLLDTFLVLVLDLVKRLTAARPRIAWPLILGWVEEWQTLLARRAVMTSEQQLGLWGELWLIANAIDPNLLIAGWRGPARESVDFFLNGIAIEVKTSSRANLHHVSQSQVNRPMGIHAAYLLSVWVGTDPVRGSSLKELVDNVLSRVFDPPALLKQVALAGYNPSDSDQYATRVHPLEVPWWFRVDDVPHVHSIDPGISQLRYIVQLDPDKALPREHARRLWRHFCGRDSPVILPATPT